MIAADKHARMEGEANAEARERSKRRLLVSTGLAVLAAAAALLPLLGRKPLADWDEAIYAEVAREMLGRNWLVPTWQFHLWFEKPPLSLWITASFFHFFGVTQFWARAESAFAGIAVVGLLHWIALRTRGTKTAWLTTIILLSTFGFLRACRVGEMDVLLSLGCYLALWGLLKVQHGNLKGWYWFWFGFAVAAMAKGAASVVLPLTLVVMFVWERWKWRNLRRPFLWGALLFAILVLPWHLYMLDHFGMPFLREYLGLHVIERATTHIEGHVTPWWYYGKVLLALASPWVLAYPFVVWHAFRRRDLRLFLVFALVVLCFFTAVATRSAKYIVPAYPALGFLTADWLMDLLRPARKEIRIAALCGVVALFVAMFSATGRLRLGLHTVISHGTVLHSEKHALPLLRLALKQPLGGPILLWSEGTVMQEPALLFYARRPVQQVYLKTRPDTLDEAKRYAAPEPLIQAVSTSPRLILFDRSLGPSIPATTEFHEIAANREFEIGTIRLRQQKEP